MSTGTTPKARTASWFVQPTVETLLGLEVMVAEPTALLMVTGNPASDAVSVAVLVFDEVPQPASDAIAAAAAKLAMIFEADRQRRAWRRDASVTMSKCSSKRSEWNGLVGRHLDANKKLFNKKELIYRGFRGSPTRWRSFLF
jgi:hypothetical protein